jgi:cell division protein FtsQ
MKQMLPLDIKIMNLATGSLLAFLMLWVLGAGSWWMLRHPAFSIEAITVQGEVTRNNAVTLRANVVPHLNGNFFTMDLNQARQAFEAVPWVRAAVVHRDFPNRVKAVLLEHEPMAIWGEDGSNKMVNQQSQVFEANVDDADVMHLPRLLGPDAQSAEVVRMYQQLNPLFTAMGLPIEWLELTSRGSWRVKTDSSAMLELGRGTESEIVAATTLFFRTLSQVSARYERPPTALLGADLRHKDGYALRLRGVTTLETQSNPKP